MNQAIQRCEAKKRHLGDEKQFTGKSSLNFLDSEKPIKSLVAHNTYQGPKEGGDQLVE